MTVTLSITDIPPHLAGLAQAGVGEKPLRVLVINNMPNKPETEEDACRFFGSLAGNYRLTFRLPGDRWPKNLTAEHAGLMGYAEASEHDIEKADIVLLTGAPIGAKRYDEGEVRYSYQANTAILDLAQKHRKFIIGWCWGGMATVRHLLGFEQNLKVANGEYRTPATLKAFDAPQKIYGVYKQQFGPDYQHLDHGSYEVPLSRLGRYRAEQFEGTGFNVVLHDDVGGPGLLVNHARRILLCFDHPEYAHSTLLYEYVRDGRLKLHERNLTYSLMDKYPLNAGVPRDQLIAHAILIQEAFRLADIPHAAPVNYDLFNSYDRLTQQQAYVQNSAAIFNALFEEAGLLDATTRPDYEPETQHKTLVA